MSDMELTVKRRWFNQKATIGELYIDGSPKRQCYTLEDVPREVKVDGQTCIPAGRYQVAIDYSHRFGRLMPLLKEVPNFDGVRIHSGNTDGDTEGCILVGRQVVNDDFIGESRMAFTELFDILQRANTVGKIWINIVNEKAVT